MHTPVYSNNQNNMAAGESPIKRYMRQNNSFYLQMQQDAARRDNAYSSNQSQPIYLRQFECKLEIQSPPRNQNTVLQKTPTPKNQIKQKTVYSHIVKEQPPQTEAQENDPAYIHRTQQTRRNGQRVIDKIKSFILDQKPLKSPKSPRKKKDFDKYFQIASSIENLHKSSQKTQQVRRELYIKKFTAEQLKQHKPFKVENPISLYLIDKRMQDQVDHRPLYQRAIDLARQKSQARLEIQLAKQRQKLMQQQQEYLRYQELQKEKHPNSMTKEKRQQFYHDLQMREKLKNLAKQQQKIRKLQQMTRQKPFVSKMSKDLFNKKVQKQELSKNFVQRTQQYKFERQKKKLQQTLKYDAQYCPFTPKISANTNNLAQKYHERKKLQEETAKRKAMQQRSLNKKLHQMSQKVNRSKSPLQQKSPQKRSNSTNLMKNKKDVKTIQPIETYTKNIKHQKQDDIPIYNRYTPERKRPLSCANIGCRKL